MKIKSTNLKEVRTIKLERFEDHRGIYLETYNESVYSEQGVNVKFVQDDISVSTKNVLRGLHGDNETWKLLSCLHGKILLAVVNCNADSKEFGKSQTFVISDSNGVQVLVPPKHANGHLVLSKKGIFHYKQSTYYGGSEKQFTYRWNEPKFNIWWGIDNPILSARDNNAKYIDDRN